MQKGKLTKRAKRELTSMLSTRRGEQTSYQTKGGVLGGQMQVWRVSIAPLYWSMDTHVPSSKIPKRDSRSRVSKTGVNLQEMVGIKLDGTSKHRDSCINMQAGVQRCKETKRAKWGHKASKASISSHGAKKGYASGKPTSRGCVLTSGHTQINHKRDGCNHTSKWPQRPTSTSPRRAQSMART